MGRIELSGAANVRDLGGFRTADGRVTAAGRLLRGDSLAALTDEDLGILERIGVATVIDFRGPDEVAAHGTDRLPAGAELVSLPVMGGNMSAIIGAAAGGVDPAQQRALLGDGKAAEMMRETNRFFVSDSEFRGSFGRAVRLVADAGGAPTLFHCSAGKDRTGWMTAIVLTALGVDRAAVTADYLATNSYVEAVYRPWIDKLVAEGTLVSAELVEPLMFQDAAYLDAAFDEVARGYGSFDRFLSAGLGLDSGAIERLRAALLTERPALAEAVE